jgi:enamine deaminase RidA (YjgF/YER057c/UK114 family)
MPQLSNPQDVHAPHGSYSHICQTPLSQTTTLITLAGQVGIDRSDRSTPSFITQVNTALANVGKCLASVGASAKDIIKVTHYVVDLGKEPGDNEKRVAAYTEFMGDHRPPSTLVGVDRLADPRYLYEIDVWAALTKE